MSNSNERRTPRIDCHFAGKLSPEEREQIIAEYQAGDSSLAIAARHGVSKANILALLRRRGCPLRKGSVRRCSLNETVFDTITPESAYWTGYLMADGCVTNRNTIVLSSVDFDCIQQFRMFVGSSHKIGITPARTTERAIRPGKKLHHSRSQARIAFTSTHMASSLARLGVIPRKTFVAKAIGLEDDRDFWRGCIDGDGFLSWHHLPTRKLPGIGLYGARPLMEQFAAFVHSRIPEWVPKVEPTGSIFKVRTAGCFAAELIRILYSGATMALARKQALATAMLDDWKEYEEASRRKAIERENRMCSAAGCMGRGEMRHQRTGEFFCEMHWGRLNRYGRLDRKREDWSSFTTEEILEVRRTLPSWNAVARYLGINRCVLMELRKRLGLGLGPSTRQLTFQGKTQSITEWAAELGIPRNRINGRLHDGWSVEEALGT